MKILFIFYATFFLACSLSFAENIPSSRYKNTLKSFLRKNPDVLTFTASGNKTFGWWQGKKKELNFYSDLSSLSDRYPESRFADDIEIILDAFLQFGSADELDNVINALESIVAKYPKGRLEEETKELLLSNKSSFWKATNAWFHFPYKTSLLMAKGTQAHNNGNCQKTILYYEQLIDDDLYNSYLLNDEELKKYGEIDKHQKIYDDGETDIYLNLAMCYVRKNQKGKLKTLLQRVENRARTNPQLEFVTMMVQPHLK